VPVTSNPDAVGAEAVSPTAFAPVVAGGVTVGAPGVDALPVTPDRSSVYATDPAPAPEFENVNVYVNVSPGVTEEPETGDTVFDTLIFPVGTVTGDGGEFTGGVDPPPG
jgi:hypothetical protein